MLVSILFGPIVAGNTTIDIQLHDTYFVFGKEYSFGDGFFFRVNVMLLFSWGSHIFLRKYALMPKRWRWVHVGLPVLSTVTMVVPILLPRRDIFLSSYLPFTIYNRNGSVSELMGLSIIVFILLQLYFWMATAILLFWKGRYPKRL